MKIFGSLRMCPVTLSYRVGAVAGSLFVAYKAMQLRQRLAVYKARRQEAEAARESVMEDVSDDAEDDLTEKTIEELLADLRAGRISSLRTVRAFLAKALRCSQETNCVTEPVADVEATAQALDAARTSGAGGELGLLHGLPVSVKECVDVQGMCSTVGLGKWCSPACDDAVIIKVLKAQGAIPFVKTNVPQTMISFDCSNPIYGITTNPYNKSRTPGGSSGGEGALIAGGGSVLGVGTDIGGSIRMPAAFCGVCGFKPTEGRMSNEGIASVLNGQSGVTKCAGVLAGDVAGCRLFMQAMCCEEMWSRDRRVVPMPFNQELATGKRRMRIGYYDNDGFFPTTPAYRRAVHEAKAVLEAAGHELVPFTPPNIAKAATLYYSLVGADGGETVIRLMRNETVDPAIGYGFRLLRAPVLLKSVLASVVGLLWPRMYTMVGNLYRRSVAKLWQLQKQKNEYRAEVCAAWEALHLDGVISPVHAMGPAPVGMCARLTATCSYTFLYNLLDFPAGVVPVTKVTDEDEAALAGYPRDDMWTRQVASLAKGMVGMPVAVQCITLPWQEELCLNLMQEVENGITKKNSVPAQ